MKNPVSTCSMRKKPPTDMPFPRWEDMYQDGWVCLRCEKAYTTKEAAEQCTNGHCIYGHKLISCGVCDNDD